MTDDLVPLSGVQLPHKWDPSYWPSGQGLMTIGYIFLGVGIFVAGQAGWSGARRLWERSAPLRFYMRIAGRAGLGLTDQWWLWCVARRQKLSSPITLLLSRDTLTHHARKFTATLTSYNAAYVSSRLRGIEFRIFGETPRK